jgi:cysteine desulfurase/selenocysteine lyase
MCHTFHMDIEQYRKEFAHIDEGYVHLNHAGVSGMSRRTTDRVKEFLNLQSRNPIGAFPWAMGQAAECRGRLARLMGVPVEHLAFTKNTAHGLSIVADGLDWREGDEVVFADCEYPANSYPWLAQQDRGVKVKVVKTQPDGRLLLEDFAAAITNRTRVVAISWVQFCTGFRIDLAALAQLAHERGALLVADVIQGLGALPLNVTELGVDIAATGSQKWLIGPLGVGGLYVHPDALTHLRLVNMGAGAVKNVMAFDTLGLDVKPTVQRYEEGTPNIMGYCGLNAALEILEEVGQPAIQERVFQTTTRIMDGLAERGYIVDSPSDDPSRAGIVMFHHPITSSDEILPILTEAKINAAARGGKLRYTPHFYTNEEDVDRALNALPSA